VRLVARPRVGQGADQLVDLLGISFDRVGELLARKP
jgi:hypothetical protein